MKVPCIVVDLKTGKRYTIDQFASKLHDGLLKDLVDNKVVDNTNFKGRTELLNVTPETAVDLRPKVRETAQKAFNAIVPFLKKMGMKNPKLEFATSDAEMLRLVKEHGGTEADITARGYYYGKDGTVVINEKFATTDTAFHENFHPLLDIIEAQNPRLIDKHYGAIARIKGGMEFIESAKRAYPTREAALPDLQKALAEAESQGKKVVAESIKKQIDNINKDIIQQKKEVITDFVAKISDGTFKIDQTNFEAARDFILKLLKDLGVKLSEKNLKYLDEKGVVDLAKKVSAKFESGEAITEKDLGISKLEIQGEEKIGGIQKSQGKLNGEDATFIQMPEGLNIVNGFYSPLEKKVLELKGNKWGSGQQAWGELNKGLKADEVQATGIEEWLKSKTNGVTKQEIVDYVKNNRVEISEVRKGQFDNISSAKKQFQKEGYELQAEVYTDSNGIDFVDEDSVTYFDKDGDVISYEDLPNSLRKIVDDLSTKSGNTKYSEYQLEGGDNYKEILVTLPSENPLQQKVLELEKVYEKDGSNYNLRELEAAKKELANSNTTSFRSSHWDEPNIVVHLRMNTRDAIVENEKYINPKTYKPNFDSEFELIDHGDYYTVKKKGASSEYMTQYGKKIMSDNNMSEQNLKDYVMEYDRLGKEHSDFKNNRSNKLVKVAFVEEVQSDWGQKGREEGFKGEEIDPANLTFKVTPDGTFNLYQLYDKNGNLVFELPASKSKGDNVFTKESLRQEFKGSQALELMGKNTPSAPFVTNTKAWTKLGLKYALQNAVKEGAERLAWTTGEQQAGRYDLSKSVEYVGSSPRRFMGDIVHDVTIGLPNGEKIKLEVIDGKIKSAYGENGGQQYADAYKGKNLDDVIGKELAEKVLSIKLDENKIFKGNDLKVGGEGMKGYYGTAEGKVGILGNTAKELVKDLTGKEGQIVETDLGNGNVQQSIVITPELKAQVEKGMPQFSKSETVSEPTTFTTRTGEKIGYTYDTDKVARERFDISKLKRLGGGSDRDVFDLGDGKLLKVAKTARGLEQNIYEGDYYLSFVPEVYERGTNYVVVERAEAPLVSNKGGAELQAMLKDLSRFNQEDFDKHNPELVQALEKYGLEDAMSYRVIWNDFTAKRNWGLKDGQPVHVDGGTFGGIQMLDRYRGKTNLSDPEFRQIYNQSKAAKKAFGDTDKYKQFSKSEVKRTEAFKDVESTTKALNEAVKDKIKTPNDIPNTMGTHLQNLTDGSWLIRDGDKSKQWVDLVENGIKEIENIFSVVPYSEKTKSILKEIKEKVANDNYDISKEVSNLSEATKKEFYKDGEEWGVKQIAEAYHKAKADGSNPELVKAVDEALGKPQFSKIEVINGQDIANEAVEMGSDQGGISEYTADKIAKEDYIKEKISIADLRKSDRDLDDYLKSEEIREYEGEPFAMNPIVSSTGEVMDGYNRIAQMLADGETEVEVYKGQPKGMQFSKSEIPNAPKEVSIKNAAIDEARAARGAEPVATRARQTWGEAWDKAVMKINNGESAEVLASEISRNPRALSDVEHAMLFANELDLNEQYWKTIDQINKGEGDINNLNTQLQDIKRKLEDNEYAVRASGTETARGLAIRRWSKKANYSADALKAEARAANKGVELDETTKKALEDKAKEIEEAQKKSEEYDATRAAEIEEKRRKEAEAAEKKALKELEEKVAFKTATRDEINTYIDKRRNKLADLISKRNESKGDIQRAKSETPINYDDLIQQEIKEIAKGYFALGNMDMNSLVKAVHEDLQGLDPSFTQRDVRDAISGYRGNKPRMTKPAIDLEMQDLKAQMRKVSEIEDYNKKNPNRVKQEPIPKSKALTDLENKLADKVKEQKLWDELEQLENEGLPTPKTRGEKRQLSQDIQDLEQMIAEKKKELGLKEKIADVEEGNLPEKGESTKKELSPELQKLQDELNNKTRLLELSKELEQLESEGLPAPKTPKEKQQLSQEVADLEKQVADKKTELKGKDAKKKRLLELSNELQSLEQNGLPAPKTPKAKAAVDQDIQNLKNQISEKQKELKLKGKIADVEQGNLPKKGQPKEPLSPELQKLQDEYNKKKRLLELSKELDDVRSGNRKAPATKAEVDADVKAAQEQLAEAKRIDDMIKRSADLDRLDSDVNYLNQEIDRLRQMAEDTGDSDYTQMADNMQQYLNDLIEQNKKKPKEAAPKSQKEIDLRNDIKNKEKQLGIDGSDEAKLKAAKTRMQNRIDELQRMIDTRNFDKPERKEVVLDEEALRLKGEVERKKLEADKIIEEERRKNMTRFERGVDNFNKIQRALVLSGIPVLGKLVTAGAARVFLAKPAEAVVGMAINKFIPKKIKDKLVTERYGDFWETQAKATVEWFKKENWLDDKIGKPLFGDTYKSEFTKVRKTGVSSLDERFGDKKYGMDDNPLEFFGRLHAALKSPTKRAEWLRSYEKRYIKAAEMGEDVSNLDVQYRLGAEAYIDAQKAIFMGDNAISQSYTNWLHSLELGGDWSKLTGAFMRMLIPVVKIPTNYVLETAQYTPGFGLIDRDMFNIVKNGFDNLTPEQADYIVKIAKKQGVGFAVFAVGAMNSDNIGGYYQQNEKRGRDDVKNMDIRIGGKDISHTFLHSPLFEVMQMGATWARIYKKSLLEGKTTPSAVSAGTFESVTGLLEQIPQAPAIEDLSKAAKSDDAWMNWLGSTANRMVVPQLMRNITSLAEEKTTEGETVKRQPRGFSEQMMKGTGFDTAPIRLADYVDMTLGKDKDFNKEGVAALSKLGALDDLTDIDTKKYMIYQDGQYTPKYLSQDELNELNQLVRDKFIALIKKDKILNSADPVKAKLSSMNEKFVKLFMKKTEAQKLLYFKNRIGEHLSQAKQQARREKGYKNYDESKISEEFINQTEE